MILFYGIAVLPSLYAVYLWYRFHEVVFAEFLLSVLLSIVIAGMCHFVSFQIKTRDFEIISGQVLAIKRIPKWISRHKHNVYKTVSDGKGSTKQVYSHSYYTYANHPEKWQSNMSFGYYKTPYWHNISEAKYKSFLAEFATEQYTEKGSRPNYFTGDRNDYLNDCPTNYIVPITTFSAFKNKVKAAPSLYSFVKVEEDYKAKLFNYPENKDVFKSDRVLGSATNKFDILEWDKLCTRLGSSKKVNLIVAGFENEDIEIALNQQAYWIGGKKNDIVICYGGVSNSVDWSFVFGWSDEELVKYNLQTIMLNNSTNILNEIEQEVIANYKIKDWSHFEYLQVEPPKWMFVVYLIILGISQIIFWSWAMDNEVEK